MPDSEFNLIQQCFVEKSKVMHANTQISNGDDASVHILNKNEALVVSTDTAVAGVHWPRDFPLDQAADRAVCAALSDLAAMGAKACWAWVSVVADSAESLEMMGTGVTDALNRYDVELSGGDTVQAPCQILNITVAGMLKHGTAMQRNQAEMTDKVWLIGKLGFSSLGLQQWFSGKHTGSFVPYFREIHPKLEQGEYLRKIGIRCCIDVSDGVLQDAGHIAKASNIGMELELSKFPGWKKMSDQVGVKDAQQAMLSGGEDYALLFTAPAHMTWLSPFACCIGECTEGDGVEVKLHDEAVLCTQVGYKHFD